MTRQLLAFILSVVLSVIVYALPLSAHAADTAQNLRTCLAGTYPSLCDHAGLTNEQLVMVRDVEYSANYRTCATGSYPSLCRHDVLSPADGERVRAAEHQANLRTCITGSYPTLCRHDILNDDDRESVRQAEYSTNLRQCLTGSYPTLCRHDVLTGEDAGRVKVAEYQANLKTCLSPYSYGCRHEMLTKDDAAKVASVARPSNTGSTYTGTAAPSYPTLPNSGCAENGSCYGDISNITGLSKTVPVRGYYRKDGTYVRGHYRSHR